MLGEELVHVYLAHRRTIHRTAFKMHGSTRGDMFFLRVQFHTDRTSGLGARKVNVKVLGDELVHVYLAHRRTIHRTAF